MCAHASRKGSQRVRFTFADKPPYLAQTSASNFAMRRNCAIMTFMGTGTVPPLAAYFQTNTATPIVAASITRASKREPE